jgi:hypothetical protein
MGGVLPGAAIHGSGRIAGYREITPLPGAGLTGWLAARIEQHRAAASRDQERIW